MRSLSSRDIVQVWEQASGAHPIDRALLLLAAALPGASRAELAALGIGRRDALLIELRERTFGTALESYAECPFCSERLEFTLSTADLPRSAAVRPESLEVTIDGKLRRFRLPDSYDMAAAVACADTSSARRLIAERCLEPVEGENTISLDESAIELMAGRMAEADPALDITIDLVCPACAGRWEMIVDIPAYLWSEIRTEARRLLRDVHTLALAYGWSEAAILDMTPIRRRSYLEMTG